MEKKDKIHVLYIITKLELGGAQKVCLSLLDGINNAGHHAGLLTGNQGVLVPSVKKSDFVFLLDSLKREVGPKIIFSEIKTFFKIISIIRKLKKKYPHLIVHTHSTKAGIMGRWAAFFAGVKKRLHTVHGFGFNDHQPKIKWYIIYFLEYLTSLITTSFICVSTKDLEEGIKLFPKFEKKSTIIRAAVEWDKFYIPAKRCSFEQEKTFIIGSTGNFKPQKNTLDLLKAFKKSYEETKQKSDLNLKLQVLGDGILRPKLEQWIKKNNMTTHIELLGWQEDVAKFTSHWNLFALTSLWEGLPCAVVEARLSKLPVVAYDVGGIFEVIFNGKNGFLIEPGNWHDFANKLSQIYLDRALYQNMCTFSDEISDFKNENMIKNHLNLYKQF